MLRHSLLAISLEPIPSQPLDFVGSSDERASNTSESDHVKDIVHMQEVAGEEYSCLVERKSYLSERKYCCQYQK